MTASTPQSHKPPAPPVNGLLRQVRLHRLWALFFVVVGGLLLAANLQLLPPAAQQVLGWGWPALLLGAGLVWLGLAVRARPASADPNFTIERADYTAGEVLVSTGPADMQLRGLAPGGDTLAAGQLPTPRGPVVTSAGGVAQLRMTPRLAVPLLPSPAWTLDLTPDLPWTIALQSSLGDLTLDLRDLTVTTAHLQSAMGHVDLTLPARGQAELSVRLGVGNLTVRVPEGMAVKVKVSRGRLATVQPEARRFVELAPGEWATPLFAVSAARCTLTVDLWAGDLTLV